MELCNHHHNVTLVHFTAPERNLIPISSTLHSLPSSALGNH